MPFDEIAALKRPSTGIEYHPGRLSPRPVYSAAANQFAAAAVVLLVVNAAYPVPTLLRFPLASLLCLAALLAGGLRVGFRVAHLALAVCGAAYVITAFVVGPLHPLVKGDIRNFVLAMLLVFCLPNGLAAERFRRTVYEWLAIASMLVALIGCAKLLLLSRGVMIPWLFDENGLYAPGTSLHRDYNTFGFALLFGLIAIMHLNRSGASPRLALVLPIGVPLLIACIILTGSRRFLIIVLLIVLWWVAMTLIGKDFFGFPRLAKARRQTVRSRTALICWMLVLAVAAPRLLGWMNEIIGSSAYRNIEGRAETLIGGAALETRLPYWEVAFRMLGDQDLAAWVFGSGFGYIDEFGQLTGTPTGDYPHSVFLSSLLYGGISQFGLLIWMLAAASLRCLRSGTSGRPILAFLVVSIVFLSISSNSVFSSEMILVSIAMAGGLPFIRSKSNPRRTRKADAWTEPETRLASDL